MKVINTQSNINFSTKIQPSFQSWDRTVYRDTYPMRWIDFDEEGFASSMITIKHLNRTEFFRYESFLPNMLDYAVKKFKNKKHVNFYSYGCSNCSETYSILMYLISKYGEDIARKFTPIFARDYDEVAISNAKSGVTPINQQEYERIQEYTGGKFEEFFLLDKPLDFKCENFYVPVNPKYYSMIDIQQADIRDDYINIPPKDTILTTINFLPYLPDDDTEKLVNNITDHLKRNSLWWLGPYEIHNINHIIYEISPSGFSNKNRPYGVYEKLPLATFEGIGANIGKIMHKLIT